MKVNFMVFPIIPALAAAAIGAGAYILGTYTAKSKEEQEEMDRWLLGHIEDKWNVSLPTQEDYEAFAEKYPERIEAAAEAVDAEFDDEEE